MLYQVVRSLNIAKMSVGKGNSNTRMGEIRLRSINGHQHWDEVLRMKNSRCFLECMIIGSLVFCEGVVSFCR